MVTAMSYMRIMLGLWILWLVMSHDAWTQNMQRSQRQPGWENCMGIFVANYHADVFSGRLVDAAMKQCPSSNQLSVVDFLKGRLGGPR